MQGTTAEAARDLASELDSKVGEALEALWRLAMEADAMGLNYEPLADIATEISHLATCTFGVDDPTERWEREQAAEAAEERGAREMGQ
jgi:hypothetical protein